ncbi:hypothetical protein BKA62DRAFT_221305 [Auriculariales sp. MPI-PUGE-AT-0066]|nr:hypothetical protein BKA62DRAFT_221305 [Auriculariales sp. MPI-PUGE-AT-0066]
MPSHTTLQTVDEGDGMEVAADAVDDGFMRSTRPGSVLEERAYRTVSPTPPATRPFFARATSFPLQAPRDRRTPTPLRDLSTPSSERDNYYEGELQREVARLRAELATMRSKARDSVASSDHQHALAQQKERAKTTVEAFREELAIAHDQLRVAQQEINRLSTAQAEAEEAARRARDTARRAVDMVYQAKAQVEGVNLGALEARREWSVVKRDEAEERVESDEVEIEEDETESWTLPGIPSEPDSARNSAHYPAIAGPARSARRPPPPTSMIRRHSDSDARTIRLESAVTRLSAKLQRVRQQRDILADRLRQIRDSEHSAASRRFSVNSDASRQSALPSEMSRRTAARIEMLFPNVDDEPTSCIWHALHPETILPNLGPTPDGMLDCGCTVDEGLFEEALTRNGVGHFMVEEDMISGDVIESGLRGALLELLQRRFDYLDGLLEIDPHTGDWENGEGHDTWEEGLQELSASSQAAQSMDARSISAFSYTTASQY